MGLLTCLLYFLIRAFRNGTQALLILCLLYFATHFFSGLRHMTAYSSALRSRSLTLSDLPRDYVQSLNESINKNLSFTYDTTDLPTQIPRIIHQTYKTEDIPPKWQYSQDSCKKHNPTYKHMFWTDESAREFIVGKFPWFLPTYDSYPYPIERVDAVRYFLLWHYGGIYIDLDVSCRRSLDPLLNFPAWVPITQTYGVSNDIMASTPGHPIMIKLALSLHDHNSRFGTGYTTVFWATGPMFLNGILGAWFKAVAGREGEGGIRTLPPIFYDTTAYTFFGHREGNSWHGGDVAVAKWAYEKLWWILAMLAVVLIVLRRKRKRGGKDLCSSCV